MTCPPCSGLGSFYRNKGVSRCPSCSLQTLCSYEDVTCSPCTVLGSFYITLLLKMANRTNLVRILNKSTNNPKKRQRSNLSESSDSDSSASGESVNCGIFVQLSDRLSSSGGYTSIITSGGAVKRDVFGFPTKLLTPSQREQCVKEFIAKLYQLNDVNQNDHINQILYKIAPDRECTREHLPEISHSSNLSQNVQQLPNDLFRKPEPKLASSTPGPRLSKVLNIYSTRPVDDSLRIINHLQLSEDDCRYVRGISLIRLSSEYSVKKLRCEILGNEGKGWVKAKKLTVKKWYRHDRKEQENYKNLIPARKEIVIGQIPQENIATTVQHWANLITERGDFIEIQSLEDCPIILRDSVIVVVGNDSGQGYTREGIRFCNRPNANSGAKVFVTTVMQGSDKALSLLTLCQC